MTRQATEILKPLELFLEPDPRHSYFRVTLRRLHEFASQIVLGDRVPGSVADQLTIAKNAYIYSWLWYPFLAPALLYSIFAVELALHTRVKEVAPQMFAGARDPTLFPLLAFALKQHWIRDEGF